VCTAGYYQHVIKDLSLASGDNKQNHMEKRKNI